MKLASQLFPLRWKNPRIMIATIIILLTITELYYAQLSTNKSKFVGAQLKNVVFDNSDDYFNELSIRGNWKTTEIQRDVYDWSYIDNRYIYGKLYSMSMKLHHLIWETGQPSWIFTLTPEQMLEEAEQWIRDLCTRYRDLYTINVVNEGLHVRPAFADYLGPGHEWILWSFRTARKYCASKLAYSDYRGLSHQRMNANYIYLIKLLKAENLVDVIVEQGHVMEFTSERQLKINLDSFQKQLNLPVQISQMDVCIPQEQDQKIWYQTRFTTMYQHNSVEGITFWGYNILDQYASNSHVQGYINDIGIWNISINSYFYDIDLQTNVTGNLVIEHLALHTGDTVIVDYVIIDGVKVQTENMPLNTALRVNGQCGGSFSERMNCAGIIVFPQVRQNITLRVKGTTGLQQLKIRVGSVYKDLPSMDWLKNNYFGNGIKNLYPLSNFTFFQTPTTVTFNGSVSTDDKKVISYDWNFGDNSSASGIEVTHNYQNGGAYVVSLTVKDQQGLNSTYTQTINVNKEGPMAGKYGKYFGSTMNTQIDYDFTQYFDQVTPDITSAWSNIQSQQNVMDWFFTDRIYKFATLNNLVYKYQSIIDTINFPSWLSSKTNSETEVSVAQWIRLYCERYTRSHFLVVASSILNPPAFSLKLNGGTGFTGYDWLIWTLSKARLYCPNLQLMVNQKAIIGNTTKINSYLQVLNLLKSRQLIDAIGISVDDSKAENTTIVKSNLDLLGSLGMKIHINSFWVSILDQTKHKTTFDTFFQLFFEHPSILGITHWQYKKLDATQSNCLLKDEQIELSNGSVGVNFTQFTVNGPINGLVRVYYIKQDKDAFFELDYGIVDGRHYRAEDMEINTGVGAGSFCGGQFSGIMNCGGYIQFPYTYDIFRFRARAYIIATLTQHKWKVTVKRNIGQRLALTGLRTVYFKAEEMFVSSIVKSQVYNSTSNTYKGSAQVEVRSKTGVLQSNAQVTVVFSGLYNQELSANTTINGITIIQTTQIASTEDSSAFKVCVKLIKKKEYFYDEEENALTCL